MPELASHSEHSCNLAPTFVQLTCPTSWLSLTRPTPPSRNGTDTPATGYIRRHACKVKEPCLAEEESYPKQVGSCSQHEAKARYSTTNVP